MKSRKAWWTVLTCALMALAVACGPPPQGDDDDDDDTTIETFADIQTQVFALSCDFATCHGGANPTNGLALDSAQSSCDTLVDVDSMQTTKKRVAPGDSSSSYLVDKLMGQNLGPTDPMPPPGGFGPADQHKIDAIIAWIDAGAVCP